LTWCERALSRAKSDLATHFLHANVLRELQRDEEALRSLRNVLFLDPDHVFAHFTAANLHRRCERKPDATRHFAQIRRLLAGRDAAREAPEDRERGLEAGANAYLVKSGFDQTSLVETLKKLL
jgi:hypothetical protein